MIYDFGGFSKELYTIKYPAKGSTGIASMVLSKLEEHDIPAKKDTRRGLDHGSWVVLRLMYPEANIPVVQVSVNPKLSPKDQYKIGKAMEDIRKSDILVIGSGATVHNLWSIKWDASKPETWAVEFDDWLIDKIEKRDLEALFQYQNLAPSVRQAVPREEHIVPLFIAMGSGDGKNTPKLLHRSYNYGTLSQICLEF